MKLKVCGMRDRENIEALVALEPDYIGFIFYNKSKRFVGEHLDTTLLHSIKANKVGVFVNESLEVIEEQCKNFGIEVVQLHGDESPDFCKDIKSKGFKTIKAFSIDDDFDFNKLEAYKPYCDYFLFDTKGDNYGGTGKKFNWDLLKSYDNEKPLFLSGGISLGDIEEIKSLEGLNIHAIDINSKFEIAPGLKDINTIKIFKDNFRK